MPPESFQAAIYSQDGPLEAAIYDRVSVVKHGETRSMGDQEVANTGACHRNGWTIGEIYADPDFSASRFARKGRPEWERLAAALAEGRFQVLVMWEPSRGDRELEMWARLLNVCRRQGVLIHITSHGRTYDVRNARDWRSLAEDGVDSAFESEKISDRVRRGMNSAALEGRPHSHVLFGYAREYDPKSGRLVGQHIDEEQAAVVRALAEKALAGVPLNALARWLNDEGVPASRGGQWVAMQVRRVLLNPSYAGYRTYNGQKIPSGWFPPILDERTHYLLLARFNDPERSGKKDTRVRWLLSGIALCGVCDNPLRMVSPRHQPAVYMCINRVPTGKRAGHVGRLAAKVDLYVESVAVAILAHTERVRAIAASEESSAELRAEMAAIETKRARLQEFYAQAASGGLSALGLAAVEGPLLAEIRGHEDKARTLRFLPALRLPEKGGLDAALEVWSDMDIIGKREFLSGFFSSIRVLPIGKGVNKPADADSVEMTPRFGSLAALIAD